MKLHIGGLETKDGWQILNIQNVSGVDHIGDISNLDMFADQTFEIVYCSHVLEHVAVADVLPTLKGIHRVLQPGGKFYCSVPDLDALCQLMLMQELEPDDKFHVMRMLFGGQTDPHDFHKVGLNLDIMSAFVELAGFSSIERVDRFGFFDDTSNFEFFNVPISLNIIAEK